MKYEIWQTAESTVLFPQNAPERTRKILLYDSDQIGFEPTLLTIIEADDWNQAQTLYHQFMGWEPYQPMEDA